MERPVPENGRACKNGTAVLFFVLLIVFEKELKLGADTLSGDLPAKESVEPLKIVRAAFKILAKVMKTLVAEEMYPHLADSSWQLLCLSDLQVRIDKRANALVNSLILQRKIIVILIVREEIFQLRRMRLQGERNP